MGIEASKEIHSGNSWKSSGMLLEDYSAWFWAALTAVSVPPHWGGKGQEPVGHHQLLLVCSLPHKK